MMFLLYFIGVGGVGGVQLNRCFLVIFVLNVLN